jgi:hypothetical protein
MNYASAARTFLAAHATAMTGCYHMDSVPSNITSALSFIEGAEQIADFS